MSERSENFNWLPPDDPLNRDNVFEMSLGPNVSVLDDDNQLLMPDQVDLDFLSSDDQFLGDNFAVLTRRKNFSFFKTFRSICFPRVELLWVLKRLLIILTPSATKFRIAFARRNVHLEAIRCKSC